jgi:hypothetical protein
MLDTNQLPKLGRLSYALDLFRPSTGGVVAKLGQVLDALENVHPDDTTGRNDLAACVRNALSSLAAIATKDAIRKVTDWLDATDEEHRLIALSSLHALRLTDETRLPAITSIVERMNESRRTPGELQAFSTVLEDLTGESHGADPLAWRKYLEDRPKK